MSMRRGLLRKSAPVVLALVVGAGLAGCDDASSASSDASSPAAPVEAPAESQQDSGGGDSAGSEEAPAEEPAAEPEADPTEDSSGWSGWFGGDSGADSDKESQSDSKSDPEPKPQKEYYANCKEARAAGAAPMYQGDPGYRPDLDRDKDGIACDMSSPGFCGGWFSWMWWWLVVVVPGGGCRGPRRLRARRGCACR
ncbi:excalibur calcium-binding domain-containing protein, partial [Actinomyces sp. ZJ308]|uniref:excalibur calcium-binding domain-containing protein n=1 Tax=Actinomyces sp. ZJ308 TaxID=2708342 RepID=UPI003263F319